MIVNLDTIHPLDHKRGLVCSFDTLRSLDLDDLVDAMFTEGCYTMGLITIGNKYNLTLKDLEEKFPERFI